MRSRLLSLSMFFIALCSSRLFAAGDAAKFVEDVWPLLEAKCVVCHGPEKQEANLRLDSWAAAKEGGDRGAAIVAGDVEQSLLVQAISFRDPDLEMPPKQKLSDQEIATLTEWVRAGATWPESVVMLAEDGSVPFGDALTDKRNPIRKLFRGERLDLWSLRGPGRSGLQTGLPSRPKTSAEGAEELHGELHSERLAEPSHSIDDFIREGLAEQRLQLGPEADRRTLIRRLTFDLIGLPPTPEEVEAFVADQAPDAYAQLVTRLLDSPRYGERQARLWLDVVRYADTNGYERDEYRPLAWQFRDYVIRSFNQDKPFDQFILEQLAGDELVAGVPNSSAEVDMLIATGFLRLGQWDSTASIFQEETRLQAEMMADLTNTTASAFLGLTMSCCQCHDHKYDPLSQADHYRFRAYFAGVTSQDDLPISVADEQVEIDAHNAELDQQAAPLKAEQQKLDEANKERHEELKSMLAEIESQKRQPRRAMGVTESDSPPATHIFYQGDFASPRDEVQPGIPTVLGTDSRGSLREPTRLISNRSTTIASRRLALANWIASADNPWTARVIVNRIWQQHFGTGIVATPNDFGYSGARPTHPELLDWLAVEFMHRGWSTKELHRLITTSATYRQASGETPAQRAADPNNQFLGRQQVRRLDAETLRDALLAVSGLLKPYEAGKPLWPPVPDELLHAQPAILEAEKGGDGGRMQGWYADPIEQTDVRSVFLVRKRCLPIPFLQAFDLPDTTVSCARRDTTVVAPQALMMLNSPEGVRYAQALATRVRGTTDQLDFDDAVKTEQLVTTLFRIALSRVPTAQELPLTIELLRFHALQHRAEEERASLLALTDLCRAILNLNEFAYVD